MSQDFQEERLDSLTHELLKDGSHRCLTSLLDPRGDFAVLLQDCILWRGGCQSNYLDNFLKHRLCDALRRIEIELEETKDEIVSHSIDLTEIEVNLLARLEQVIELAVCCLRQHDLNPYVLAALQLILYPKTSFHSFSKAAAARYKKSPLVMQLLHHFSSLYGFTLIKERLSHCNELNLIQITCMLRPFGSCAEYLSPDIVQQYFVPVVDGLCTFVEALDGNALLQQDTNAAAALLLPDLCGQNLIENLLDSLSSVIVQVKAEDVDAYIKVQCWQDRIRTRLKMLLVDGRQAASSRLRATNPNWRANSTGVVTTTIGGEINMIDSKREQASSESRNLNILINVQHNTMNTIEQPTGNKDMSSGEDSPGLRPSISGYKPQNQPPDIPAPIETQARATKARGEMSETSSLVSTVPSVHISQSGSENGNYCRVCFEAETSPKNPLINPCRCTGSAGSIHRQCLVKWIHISGHRQCEVCNARFNYVPVGERLRGVVENFRKNKRWRNAAFAVLVGLVILLYLIIFAVFPGGIMSE